MAPLVLYVLLLGAAAVGFVAADAVREEIVRQEVKQEKQISQMRELQARASGLPGQCQDPELRRILQKLSDNLRFSDPVSSPALEEIESELSDLLEQIQTAIQTQD